MVSKKNGKEKKIEYVEDKNGKFLKVADRSGEKLLFDSAFDKEEDALQKMASLSSENKKARLVKHGKVFVVRVIV